MGIFLSSDMTKNHVIDVLHIWFWLLAIYMNVNLLFINWEVASASFTCRALLHFKGTCRVA